MPAAMPRIPIRHIVAALHGMLRQRIQCIRPPNVSRSYFPGAFEVLRGIPRDQDVGANHTRSSWRQARTSCELKAMHLVRARGLRYPDIDDGSLHVDKVQLGTYADSTDYAVQRLMERSGPDLRGHALHIFADQSLAYSADRLRNFVIAEDRRCQLLFPLAAEQPDHTFDLDVLFRIELVSEVDHERRPNGFIESEIGRRRIWQSQQVFVEPTDFAIGEGADLMRAEDIGHADGTSGDFETRCKYIDHAVVVRPGANEAGHGQIARSSAGSQVHPRSQHVNLP